MSALSVYRDDGPLARRLGLAVGRGIPLDEVVLTLLAGVALAAVLAAAQGPLPSSAAAAGALAFVLVAGAGSGRPAAHALTWVVPPLLRAAEYAFLIALTALAEPDAMPFCFAFLGVLAFHHYDTVYRLRHQRIEPPAWVRALGGGWDGRLLVASVLALAGALGPGLLAAAAVLGVVYVVESASSWLRPARRRRPASFEAEDEDELLE